MADHITARKHVINGSGRPPATIAFRYCPTDAFHWRSEGYVCPVCKVKIKEVTFVPKGD